MEILSEIANNDALTVTKESNGYVVSLSAQMQEAGPKDMEKKATELALPVEETHLPGGGRDDSAPVYGVASLEQHIEERRQQRSQGNEFVPGICSRRVLRMWPLTGWSNTTPTPDTIRHSSALSDEPRLPAESTKQNGLYGTNEPPLNEKIKVLHICCKVQQETQASGKVQDPVKLPTEPQLAIATRRSPDGKFFPASPPTCIAGSLPAKEHSPGHAKDYTPPSTPATTPPHSVAGHEPTARRKELKHINWLSSGQKNVPCSAQRNLEKAVCWIHGEQYGNGTFVSGKSGGSDHFWLISCCHLFFKKGTPQNERKRIETFRTTLLNSLGHTTFQVEGSTPVSAEDVLLDVESPVFCFDLENDLLALKVKDPTTFDLDIIPYPLNPDWKREEYLMGAQMVKIVHYRPEKSDRRRPGHLQFTLGRRMGLKDTDQTMKVIRHTCDTDKGSSGAPLMYATAGGVLLLLGVHVGDGQTSKWASVLNESFLSEMMRLMRE